MRVMMFRVTMDESTMPHIVSISNSIDFQEGHMISAARGPLVHLDDREAFFEAQA
jgi:hypothetical protein